MPASQGLFDRFERRNLSWFPIIALSLAGLVGTMLSLTVFAKIKSPDVGPLLQERFDAAREEGFESPILKELSLLPQENVGEAEKLAISKISESPETEKYLVAMEVVNEYAVQLRRGERKVSTTHLHCWTDPSKTILFCAIVKRSHQNPGDDQAASADQWVVEEIMAVTQTKSDRSPFVVTSNLLGKSITIEDETTISGGTSLTEDVTLVSKTHQERLSKLSLGEENLLTFEESDCVAVLQSYFDLAALAHISRGGRTKQELLQEVRDVFQDPDLEPDMRFLTAILLGRRNAYSHQVDQFVLQRYVEHVRTSDTIAREVSPENSLIFHPLSCPVRARLILGRSVADHSVVGAQSDPAELVKQVEYLSKDDNSPQREINDLQSEVQQDTRYEVLFEMKDPFPATVYTIKNESEEKPARSETSDE